MQLILDIEESQKDIYWRRGKYRFEKNVIND
jgi:hypothetical protein